MFFRPYLLHFSDFLKITRTISSNNFCIMIFNEILKEKKQKNIVFHKNGPFFNPKTLLISTPLERGLQYASKELSHTPGHFFLFDFPSLRCIPLLHPQTI